MAGQSNALKNQVDGLNLKVFHNLVLFNFYAQNEGLNTKVTTPKNRVQALLDEKEKLEAVKSF